jgi:hypothetical protein
MLGCGNSSEFNKCASRLGGSLDRSTALSQDMYDDGYHSIVNVDYSSIVIDRMKALHQIERPEMECGCFCIPPFRSLCADP